jgi:hypothetical protein
MTLKTLRSILLASATITVSFALSGCDIGDLLSKLPF